MNKTEIKCLLLDNGVSGVVSTQKLASALGWNIRTISGAVTSGKLKRIDRNAFALDDVVNWLYANQRYIVRLNK